MIPGGLITTQIDNNRPTRESQRLPMGVSQIIKEDRRVDMVNHTINRLNQQYSDQMNNVPTFNNDF